jgi:ABC-2 type transport system ATP-binding protein
MTVSHKESKENIIEISGLTKYYKSKLAVKQLNISVKEGEIFGLIGPNGAGKTTTIECMLGTKIRDGGDIRIFGHNIDKEAKKVYQKIGVQFQSNFYPDRIKVYEICLMISSLYDDVVDYHILLEQFGLHDKSKQLVSTLSGGEKQKLSVLLSLINKPKLIILDELTTGLDPKARREVWRFLKQLKSKGLTILLTSHYMDEVEYLCDRLMIINEGEKVITGTVNEIKSNYKMDSLEAIYLQIVGEEEANYENTLNAL